MKNWKKMFAARPWIDASFRVREVFEMHLETVDGYMPVRITLYETASGRFWARPDHYPSIPGGPGVDAMGVAADTAEAALAALFDGFEAMFNGHAAEQVSWVPEEEYFG